MKIYSILFFLLSCFSAISAQPQIKAVKPDAVDKFVAERMQALKIPGLALAVLKDGKVLKMSVYGQANLETETPVKPESVFMIASLSKQFIATAILLLQKDGKLSLDDKVSKYLDGFPDAWKEITFRQLLTHTSGIVRAPADYHPYRQQSAKAGQPLSLRRALLCQPYVNIAKIFLFSTKLSPGFHSA